MPKFRPGDKLWLTRPDRQRRRAVSFHRYYDGWAYVTSKKLHHYVDPTTLDFVTPLSSFERSLRAYLRKELA